MFSALIKRLSLGILPIVFFLTGCCPILQENSGNAYRVVTQVEVIYNNGSVQKQYQFFRESSIQHILNYLCYIDPYGVPREDPETATGRNYEIRVIYSDGSFRQYQQRADRYMRVDGGKWKRIDPEKAMYLSGLLGMMSSEAPPEEESIPPLLLPQI